MTTYLINHLRIPGGIPTEDELAYLEHVEAAVAPYDGKWLAIDAQVQVVEGAWPGSVVLMEFPDMAKAKEWYDSAGYQKIPPRRTTHSISDLVLVDGVGPGFTTAGFAQRIRATIAGAAGNGSDRASTVSASTRGGARGEPMLSRIGGLAGLVLAWRNRRARQAADLSCCRSPNGNGHAPPLPTTTRWVIPASSPILSEEGGAQPSG
jgi:uncharacterized protein (DUF1330 family)